MIFLHVDVNAINKKSYQMILSLSTTRYIIIGLKQILLIETKLRGNLQKDNTSTWWCHGGCRYSKGPTLTSFQLRSIFS